MIENVLSNYVGMKKLAGTGMYVESSAITHVFEIWSQTSVESFYIFTEFLGKQQKMAQIFVTMFPQNELQHSIIRTIL